MNQQPSEESKRRYYDANYDKILERKRERYRNESADTKRAQGLWLRHKLTLEAFNLLWQTQHGCCYLCEQPLDLRNYVIDHNHGCCSKDRSCERCRRGIAHRKCNILIGFVGDDPEVLDKITKNLKAANELQKEMIV